EHTRDHPTPGYSAGKGLSRLANLVAHHGGEFQSHQAKADYAERIQNELGVRGNLEFGAGDGGPKATPYSDAENNQNGCGDEGAYRADVVQPLPNAEPGDVEGRQEGEKRDRANHGKSLAVG